MGQKIHVVCFGQGDYLLQTVAAMVDPGYRKLDGQPIGLALKEVGQGRWDGCLADPNPDVALTLYVNPETSVQPATGDGVLMIREDRKIARWYSISSTPAPVISVASCSKDRERFRRNVDQLAAQIAGEIRKMGR
jgi:hypothetical protein